jgi:hypothetical protein
MAHDNDKRIEDIVAYIRSRVPVAPDVAIVCGSGLSGAPRGFGLFALLSRRQFPLAATAAFAFASSLVTRTCIFFHISERLARLRRAREESNLPAASQFASPLQALAR